MQPLVKRWDVAHEPQRRRYERALEHWSGGEYHLCLAVLDDGSEADSSPSALLAARALLRFGRDREAERRLLDSALLHHATDARATYALLMGLVRARSGDLAAADRYFTQVRRLSPHRSIVAESWYEQALSRYQAGHIAAARRLLAGALRPIEDIIYARSLALLGWIETATGNFADAYERFAIALDVLGQCRARDAYLQASTLHGLAALCSETGVGTPATLDAEFDKIRWTSNLLCQRVQTLRSIGLAYQRRGELATAGDRFVAAAAAGEGTAWSIFGNAECANLALLAREPLAARMFAAKATDVAERVEANGGWDTIEDEERLALLVLAAILARLGDGARAQGYANAYGAHRALSVRSALRHDKRLETFEATVAALARGACGERAAASAELLALADTWDAIGYRARAVETRDDARRFAAADAGGDFLPIPLQRAAERARLSLRDEQVLRMVASGASDAEIAHRFTISRRTARNVVNRLYGKFGVHTRTQLVVAVNGRR